ncbi:heavy metal-responsive transcriptional regulator (plasmid) [Cellulomonas sp. WB94]|uniref:heavy metal-responsive transcriptional regulator n=1 Tax=Cellulomonas sp. WB94 TaxID=2173174 RepID=UPI000D56D40F|nr:heavy metal-responsive transcriptional regulator [Cellulomonas sp. WB94]PVU81427.1 heavy metal-responsive transcriptional regulator [Cellulomonas sp. WB94]
MLIGALAQTVGLPSQTIRFYERRGLLHPPIRGGNGYRCYDDAAITRLDLIRAAQAAGLTLAQIRGIVDLRDHGEAPCTHVAELIDSKLVDVRRRLSELTALEAELEQLRERGRRLDPADCTNTDVCHILARHG